MQDAFDEGITHGHHVVLFHRQGAFALADVDVGRPYGVVRLQGRIKRQLGVFGGVLDAVPGLLRAFGLVVQHQRHTVGAGIQPVDLADQGDVAQRELLPLFGPDEAGACGLMPRQPLQVAVAHGRPGRSKRQERRRRQTHVLGHRVGSLVDGVARADGAVAAFVEGFEHGMQPQAEITFVHHVLQFVRLLQAQLAQGEETVGAAAQVFVGTGRQAGDRQRLALGRGPRRRRGGHGPGPARVLGLDPPPRLQQKFLHQRAGQQGFTSRV